MACATRYADAEIAIFRRLAGGEARDVDDLAVRFGEAIGRTCTRAAADALMRRIGVKAHDVVRAHGAGGGDEAELRRLVRDLKAENRRLSDSALTDERVKREILGLKGQDGEPPAWMLEPSKSKKSPGVPVLFATDWHWSEVVEPSEVGGVNRYNLEIARERARTFFANAINILESHMTTPEYPGVVLAIGGDMVSGDIHEELSLSNEVESMPAVIDLRAVLRAGILELRKRWPVFVVAVTGNHARTSTKPRHKRRNFSNYDWLLYRMLEGDLADKGVRWFIPDGPDALFQVYGHRFLLTHGDTLGKGGDGIIGFLGPVIRGDQRRRSRNAQIAQEYDTLIAGHYHQLVQMQRVIVGGSLVGYNEFASAWAMPYEPPRQAMWIVHPTRGITFSVPVHVDKERPRRSSSSWVQWQEAAA